MRSIHRRALVIGTAVTTALALAGCAGGSGSAPTSSAAAPSASTGGASVSLAGACPATVTIQTDWNPEADHGALYEMVGPNATVDTAKKTVTGDLVVGGKSTGVKIQIRSGGPAIGFQSVTQQMYTDKSITLGYVSTDEAVQNSAKLPTTAVFAETSISPQMIMWDPKTYPAVTDIKSLGSALATSGGVIRYFKGAAYMSYLQGAGILPAKVLDGSYDGTPAKFVAAQGKDAQQGFATAEPYIYSKEVGAWMKPVKFQLINDTGYPIYPEAMSIRSADKTSMATCLKKLVPVMQQADVDYFANPSTANQLIVSLVKQYNNGWVYDQQVADFAAQQYKSLKLIANGPSGYVGEMETARVQKIIDIDTPIFTKGGTPPKSGITPADLFTNEFMSKSIKVAE
ncbi:ABC transporter substrate-binding protein [uncultured Amnibacterium sp.]|uniref:ABC transporter substrate-binding protein n=1 Tax=uncultured Amnibacterium sp. TaxID=1631851 RepID=UPI0035CAD331